MTHKANPRIATRRTSRPTSCLQPGSFNLHRLQGLADVAHFGVDASGPHLGDPLALDNQRAGEDEGKVFASRPSHLSHAVPGDLSDRHGFAGEQRLIGGKVVARKDHGICRNSIPFGQYHEVIGDDLSARNSLSLPATDHQRPRAGEVTQGLQRPLRLSFLVKSDAQHHEDKAEEHQGFLHVPQDQVDRAAGQQQKEHRLSDHIPGGRKNAAALGRGKLVVAVLLQATGDFRFREAGGFDVFARSFHIALTRHMRFVQVIDSCSTVAMAVIPNSALVIVGHDHRLTIPPGNSFRPFAALDFHTLHCIV